MSADIASSRWEERSHSYSIVRQAVVVDLSLVEQWMLYMGACSALAVERTHASPVRCGAFVENHRVYFCGSFKVLLKSGHRDFLEKVEMTLTYFRRSYDVLYVPTWCTKFPPC